MAQKTHLGDQIIDFFSDIFSTEHWPARWHCGRWSSFHGWMYIAADLMIWAAYFAIPILLFRLLHKRTDIPFPKIFWLFIAFIFLCGGTHLVDALIFWWPVYRFSAFLKLVTGVVSLFTVYVMYKILPMVFNLRTAAQLQAEIEERKMIQEELTQVFNYSAIGLALVSTEGKWLKVNPALVKLLGYTPEELLASTFQQITHKDDLELDMQHIKQLLNSEIDSYQMEKRYLQKNGNWIWALLTVSLVRDDKGKPLYFISQISDITNSKKLSSAIELMNKKDEFMSIAAHELKTPITSIKGTFQLIERQINSRPNLADIQKFTSVGNKQIEKLTWIVSDLLDVNKIHTGQMSLTLSSFRVDELIGNALEQVHYERHGKKIRLQGKTSLTIEADKVRLEQVLVNLLTNAIKYSPKADEVTIRVQIIDSSLKISVKDNGIGIPSDKIPHLFGRYYRVENSSQSFSGLGMGLYISSEIVKLHNGRIGVSSELGEGSEFWFSIPINQ